MRNILVKRLSRAGLLSVAFLSTLASAEPGQRLPATGGVSSVEGAGGGGLTPWALISGYATPAQTDALVFASALNTDDFRLQSYGVAMGIADRVELSLARTELDIDEVIPDESLQVKTLGLKVKLFGDAVFAPQDWWPQLSVGIQAKRSSYSALVETVTGAIDKHDEEFYASASKLYFNALAGRNLLINIGARRTRANQFGLLGFGGPQGDDYQWCAEASVGLMLTDNLVIGTEYRQKPDNLALKETAASDLFLAWFIHKRLSLTAAYVDLGPIVAEVPVGLADKQRGAYLSAQWVF